MVKINVCFVVRLIDDYTAKNITGSVVGFTVAGKRLKYIKKPEGHYVFTGDIPPEDLLITTTHYKDRVLPYSMIENGGEAPVIVVRLFRKAGIYFLDCDWITGEGTAKRLAYIPTKEVAGLSFKKSEQIDGKTIIHLGGYSTEQLIGNCYCIGEEKERSIFYIIGRDPGGGYEITSPTFQSQQSGGRLNRVHSDISDINGKFTIPVLKAENEDLALTLESEVKEWGCYYEV